MLRIIRHLWDGTLDQFYGWAGFVLFMAILAISVILGLINGS